MPLRVCITGYTRLYASLCVYNGGILGHMPLCVCKRVYTGPYASLCALGVYVSLGVLVGGSSMRGGLRSPPYSRFTVGHTLGFPCSAHLSTFSQECGTGRAERASSEAGPPFPFHCWPVIPAQGERYTPWDTTLVHPPPSLPPVYMPPSRLPVCVPLRTVCVPGSTLKVLTCVKCTFNCPTDSSRLPAERKTASSPQE